MNNIENIDILIKKIRKGELLSISEFDKVFIKAKEILDKRDNIAILDSPITICGCINAHFEELKDIFRICGDVSKTQYLFLGDYVGKGFNGLSAFMLLILYLIKYPNNLTLLRGNHDSYIMSSMYGLHLECSKKYTSNNESNHILKK